VGHFEVDNVYNFIVHETYVRILWEKLEYLYASRSGSNKLYLLKDFVGLKYKERTPFMYHLSNFQELFDKPIVACINPILIC